MINQDSINKYKYIYITPFLNEVQRIKKSCSNKKFYEPLNNGNGKLDSLHKLLQEGKNIASTHSLFQMSTEVTKELIMANDYILILDEVFNVLEQVPLRKDDLSHILEHSHINNDNLLIWDDLKSDNRYNDIKTMALNSSLIMINNTLLMWNFPVSIFKSFKECFILTYMFRCQIQRYYYDLHGVEYKFYSLNNYKLIPYENRIENKEYIKNNIKIFDGSINNIGEKENALSSTWFKNYNNKYLVKKLQKNLYNFFQNKINAKNKDILWTTFKNAKNNLKGKGYTTSFLSCNARASNDYRNKHILAYCVNIYLNPIVKQFFIEHDIEIFEDEYALSEMIQWVWRSAIRMSEKITIYIPSNRMRKLFFDWINS